MSIAYDQRFSQLLEAGREYLISDSRSPLSRKYLTDLLDAAERQAESAWDAAINEAFEFGVSHDTARDELLARNLYRNGARS